MTVDNRTHDAVIHSGDQDPSGHNRFLPRIAALALAGLVGGGVVAGADRILNRSENRAPAVAANQPNTDPAPNPPESPVATPTSTKLPEATASPQESAPATNSPFGTLNIAEAVQPGDEFILAPWGGQDVKLPRLNEDNPNKLGEAATAHLAYAVSTGKFKDTAFQEEGVQADLESKLRKPYFIDPYANLNLSTRPNFQMVFHDTKESPVSFEWSLDKPNTLVMKGGTAYMRFSDSRDWQSIENMTGKWKGHRLEELEFTIGKDADGQPTINHVYWYLGGAMPISD